MELNEEREKGLSPQELAREAAEAAAAESREPLGPKPRPPPPLDQDRLTLDVCR